MSVVPVGAERSVLQGVAGTSTERAATASWRWGVAAAALLSVLLRLRFVWTPITSDEGGYLAIARAWRHGAVLYRDVWVDRPQGLIVLNRMWDTLGLGTPAGIRVLAIVAGVVGVVACASIAKTLFGPTAAVLAALFVAVLSSAPDYEGFIADGELLSGAAGAAGLAIAVTAIKPMDPKRLYTAGLIGGVAISLKQSGFDAILTAVVVVAATALLRRESLRGLGAILGGIATVFGAMAIHGALTGWDRFWYAFVGYRIAARSIATNAELRPVRDDLGDRGADHRARDRSHHRLPDGDVARSAFGTVLDSPRLDRARHRRVRGRRAVPPPLLGDPGVPARHGRRSRDLAPSSRHGYASASPASWSSCRSCTRSAMLGCHAARSRCAWTRTAGSPATRRSPGGTRVCGRRATRCTCCAPALASTRTRTPIRPIRISGSTTCCRCAARSVGSTRSSTLPSGQPTWPCTRTRTAATRRARSTALLSDDYMLLELRRRRQDLPGRHLIDRGPEVVRAHRSYERGSDHAVEVDDDQRSAPRRSRYRSCASARAVASASSTTTASLAAWRAVDSIAAQVVQVADVKTATSTAASGRAKSARSMRVGTW